MLCSDMNVLKMGTRWLILFECSQTKRKCFRKARESIIQNIEISTMIQVGIIYAINLLTLHWKWNLNLFFLLTDQYYTNVTLVSWNILIIIYSFIFLYSYKLYFLITQTLSTSEKNSAVSFSLFAGSQLSILCSLLFFFSTEGKIPNIPFSARGGGMPKDTTRNLELHRSFCSFFLIIFFIFLCHYELMSETCFKKQRWQPQIYKQILKFIISLHVLIII